MRAKVVVVAVLIAAGSLASPNISNGANILAIQGPIEAAAVAGAASPPWTPDTRIAVYGSGSATEWYLVQATATYRYVGASLATAHRDPSNAVIGPSGSGYARDYEGISSVVHPAGTASGYRIGFTHAERHCTTGGQTWQTLASVGLITSTDAGRTWVRKGQLVTSETPTTECVGFTGVGQPSALISGSYVDVFFTDWTPNRPNQISVVRAPVASAAIASAYRKYDGAAGWTAARGGADVAVIARPTTADAYAASPSVSWNATLGTYIAVFETNFGFDLATSANLLSWSTANRLLTFPKPKATLTGSDPWWAYPTLLSTSSPAGATDSSNYLYFAIGTWAGGTPHTLVRAWAPIGTPSLPTAVTIAPGGSWQPSVAASVFAWVCTGDVAVTVGGVSTALYDNDPRTGLVLGLSPGLELATVKAPWGASCAPVYPSGLAAAESSAAARAASGCGGSCLSVTTITYDQLGHPISGPLPAPVRLGPGVSWKPTGSMSTFAWACTGDVKATVGSVTSVLYDNLPSTGLVVGLVRGAPVTLIAPWGATCVAAAPWDLGAAADSAVASLRASGCGTVCVSVREIEYGIDGSVVVDVWR